MSLEYIQEVDVKKFNPYHDRLGRFTTAGNARSFTIRTKAGLYQQGMVNRAIEREKERVKNEEIYEEPPKYKKAKNIGEAVSDANRMTKDGNFSISGLHLNTVNAFNEAMFNVEQMFGNKLDIKGIKPVKKDNTRYYQGSYNPLTKEISIRGGKSPSAMDNAEKRAQKQFKEGFLASKDRLGTFYHEIAHSIWYELPKDAQNKINDIFRRTKKEAYEEWMDAGGSRSGVSQREFFGKKLSRYAAEDEREFFSEAFSQIMSKRTRPVSREVKAILNEYYKKEGQ